MVFYAAIFKPEIGLVKIRSNLKKNMAVPPYESNMLSRVFLAGELATLVD